MPAIEVRDLTVRFGELTAVAGISFDVDHGEVVTLIGPNGAGKTTTVETIEGYRRPTAGSVRVLGLDPFADHDAVVARLGVMLQEGGTYPQLPARRALRLFASYYPDPADPDELLDAVGLTHVAGTAAKRLSGGERQRLALALALVGRPDVVFLDEPTSGIDPAGRGVIRSIIEGLRAAGTAVVLTTHELEEAERLADRVLVIDRGTLVWDRTLAELARTSSAIHFETVRTIDVAALGAELGAAVVAVGTASYRVDSEDAARLVAPLSRWLEEAGHEVVALRAGGSSLEDLFAALTDDRDEAGRRDRSPR